MYCSQMLFAKSPVKPLSHIIYLHSPLICRLHSYVYYTYTHKLYIYTVALLQKFHGTETDMFQAEINVPYLVIPGDVTDISLIWAF